MPSYLITGVARGIGYEFVRQYSSDPKSIVVGLVRNKAATDKKISEDAELKSRTNIHILEADVTSIKAMEAAAAETAKITGGALDYVIANAANLTLFDAFDGFRGLADKAEQLDKELRQIFEVNVIGVIHTFNIFMSLLLKGEAKKGIVITSGFADPEFTREYGFENTPLYSTSKAAVNMVVAKYSAEYKKDGVLFLALSPGMVDVGHYSSITPEQLEKVMGMMGKFVQYEPSFKGPVSPEVSVTAVRSVIENASIEKGNGGDFLSHLGNKRWL